jgi:hypothetical protein
MGKQSIGEYGLTPKQGEHIAELYDEEEDED